jgi:hypothetical protein
MCHHQNDPFVAHDPRPGAPSARALAQIRRGDLAVAIALESVSSIWPGLDVVLESRFACD